MKKSRSCSILDVAKLAKVSPATVSRVLNNGPVSAATRAMVEGAIRKTGFQPDSHAVLLRKGRTKKIGVIVPDIANPAYSLTVKTAHDVLKRAGYSVILGISYGLADEERQALEMMQRERVSGLVISTCEGEDDRPMRPLFEQFVADKVPLVFLGREARGLPVDTISIDNVRAMETGVRYLVRTGRKRLAFLAGGDGFRAARERLNGFRKALTAHGLKPAGVAHEGPFTLENGQTLAARLLASTDADALVCGNDLMAIGALKAARQANRRVPEDVAVLGFDDIELAALVHPRLTTIRQSFGEIVQRACALLVERVEKPGQSVPQEQLLEPEIIIRETA